MKRQCLTGMLLGLLRLPARGQTSRPYLSLGKLYFPESGSHYAVQAVSDLPQKLCTCG